MRWFIVRWFIGCLLLGVLGCNKPSQPKPLPERLPPLTLEAWREMSIEKKYDGATLERLRDNDAKLRGARAWDRFMMEVVVPERKKDLPGDIPGA